MAISNELSSDIAAALLAQKKTPQELDRLKEVILKVHTTLQEISEEARDARSKETRSKEKGLSRSTSAD